MASSADASTSDKTPAQLMAERDAAHSHNVTVEDVIDEDDIQHPPPSQSKADSAVTTNGTMSAKAAGKQKEKPSVLDTQDEEAFPSLGPAPKSTAQAPGWGAKGSLKTSASPALSGSSTPARPGSRGPGLNLPSQNRDHFDIRKEDLNTKAALQKVLTDAKRKYKVNTGIQDIKGGAEVRIWAEGPQDRQVRNALLEISKAISVEKEVKIEVPAAVSSIIIGKSGANINALQQKHGVRINIKRDSKPASSDPEESRTDVVEIKGDAASVREVNYKINELVKQHQPKVNMPLREVPPEFYPFLSGRYGSELQNLRNGGDLEVNIPEYVSWQAQPPPRAVPDGRPQFVPHGNSHITLSGDREAALQARLAIEQFIRQLEQELTTEELPVEQVLHPYIVGQKGMSPQEFFEQTGCAIIIPPGHHETDDIHIIGPADRLEDGRNLAEQLMSQRYNRPLDLSKQYANAPMGHERHSRALARYLQQKALEREFADTHNSEVIFPIHANAGSSWSVISGDQQKAVSAKNDLMKIAQAFPTSRIQLVDMDPFYHPHIGDMFSQRLQDDHGVIMIVPESADEPVVLVYEGPAQDGPFVLPRQRPTSPEQKEFERALQAAQAFLLGEIPSQEITLADIEVPRQHHDRVGRFVRNQQQAAPAPFPIQLDFGAPRRGQRAAQAPEKVSLRGPSPSEVEELRKQIEAFLLEVEQDEKERDYTTTCDFPEKFVKNLVGKQGANINALKEKHDVEIDTREPGKVKIKGPQKKAEACKVEIIKLGKQYEDEVNYSIKVDPKFHGELIGKGGENLTKLQNKVNNEVRIDFPRAQRGGNTSDNISEAGGAQQRQAADEIRIRGPKAKADKIRDELLSLTQYLQDNSHTATVSVSAAQVKSLIGRGGSELNLLREGGADINVPNTGAGGKHETDRVEITIKGNKAAVDKAKAEIQKRSKAFDSILTQTITVDPKYHRDIIGSGGSNISKIVSEAGGPERSAEAVQFPKKGETSADTITVRGTKEVVEKIIASITSYVEDKENQITETVDVPAEQHRLLIGTAGNIRKSIEQQFKVSLDIPRRETGSTGVKIAGRPEAVAQAKEHIISLTKQAEGVTIMVPRAVHHAVSNNGQIFRELSRQGIKVDHKGRQPPKRPATARPARKANADAPLITDEPSDTLAYQFELIHDAPSESETGEIPWVLSGKGEASDDAIAKAQKQIEAAIAKAQKPRHVGYLRLADPGLHRYVIGSKGSTINRIRKETNCDIQVPKSQNDGEEIEIFGEEEDIKDARDMILSEVEKAGN